MPHFSTYVNNTYTYFIIIIYEWNSKFSLRFIHKLFIFDLLFICASLLISIFHLNLLFELGDFKFEIFDFKYKSNWFIYLFIYRENEWMKMYWNLLIEILVYFLKVYVLIINIELYIYLFTLLVLFFVYELFLKKIIIDIFY